MRVKNKANLLNKVLVAILVLAALSVIVANVIVCLL